MNKIFIGIIIILFINTSFVSSTGGYSEEINQIDTDITDVCEPKENVLVTCRTFGFPGEPSQETTMSLDEAELLYDKIKELQIENARDPLSDKTQQLQHEIITLADEHNLLPAGLSVETLKSRFNPSWKIQNRRLGTLPLQSKASELFCTFVSAGSGGVFPIIVLPRFIPILMTPIPRLFMIWNTQESITSCGGLLSGTGFIAYGQQKGIALGFWGIGFTFSLPPFMGVYGLAGYALFARVNAEEIEYYPPNYPPDINAFYPLDGAQNIPISTSELSFHISDPEKELMSYAVTTDPDIGSGNGNLKPDGTYSVPISGLEGSEEYTWHVQVSDGENLVDSTFTFTTEAVAPVLSNPSPSDGAKHVHIPFTQLSFQLEDPQGDLMDYTVETSPYIGSGSGTGVSDGTYTVDISGLEYSTEYTWHVDATDGIHWTEKIFSFTTEEAPFNPFDEGWQYRKQITIDHTKVNGDLTNFPVLVSTVDSDLRDKAQDDGDDVLFMEESGVSRKLFHEIEQFDGSSGELVAWVDITSLSSIVDTTLWLYYGNPSCSNQQNTVDVWDSNYWMVQHLNEDGTGIRHDSTSNNNDGIPGNYDGDEATDYGKIDGGDFFDGGNDYMTFEGYPISTTYTVSCWIKLGDISGTQFLLDVYSDEYMGNGHEMIFTILYKRVSGDYFFTMSEHAGGNIPTSQLVDYEWHYFVGVKTSSNSADVYVDGSYEHTHTGVFDTPEHMVIGCDDYHNTYYSNGIYDEVRTSNIARSPSWISTECTNQNDPSSFLSFGPEETGP